MNTISSKAFDGIVSKRLGALFSCISLIQETLAPRSALEYSTSFLHQLNHITALALHSIFPILAGVESRRGRDFYVLRHADDGFWRWRRAITRRHRTGIKAAGRLRKSSWDDVMAFELLFNAAAFSFEHFYIPVVQLVFLQYSNSLTAFCCS